MMVRTRVQPGSRLVIKVGSSSLTRPEGDIDDGSLARIADEVSEAWTSGYPTVLVSSGAVAAGLPALGLASRPRDVPGLQVAAAVGQGRLMERYFKAFEERGLVAGQILLTRDILANREQYLHAREALERMLDSGVVPIVNENDTVVVDELRLGDNDRLAAIVSHLVGAGMLLLLTDTAGLFAADPRLQADAELLGAVRHTDEILDVVAGGGSGPLGSGGVATKVAAARMAAWSGIPTVIAAAGTPGIVAAAVSGETVGTWVAPHPSKLSARKLWIAFGKPAGGRIVVDDGAARALVGQGRSLLAVGVRAIHGQFASGDAVEVLDERGSLVAKGQCEFSAADLKSHAEADEAGVTVIHRDNLVVLSTNP